MVAPFMPDAEKLAAVREGLPAVGAGIYLDTPVAGPLPAETAAAMADVASWELTTGRAGRDRRADVLGRVDEARAALATVLTVGLEEVVLVRGLEAAAARAVRAIDWRAADACLVAGPVGGLDPRPWLPPGVHPVAIDLPPEPGAALAALRPALGPAVRLVACPMVSEGTGARLPTDAIAEVAHERGALLLVDASQAAGAIRVCREELGADLLAARSEAWLLGPDGLAVLAAAPELLERAVPADDPGRGTDAGEDGPAPGFHLPSVVGLARSAGWLSMYVGLPWIEARGLALARRARERLAGTDGVEVLTPGDAQATIVVFRVAGWPASLVLEELGSRVFVLASVVPELDAVRIGTGFFNTEAEIDRLVDAVDLLARHSPATLPPRRLGVLGQDA